MAQQIQELISKIKSEGIEAAEKKARDIESSAQKKSEDIISAAEKKAQGIISNANAEAEKIQDTTHDALVRASRDMLLDLKEHIRKMLSLIVRNEIKEAFSPEALLDVVSKSVELAFKDEKNKDVIVAVGQKEYEKLKKSFLAKLQQQLKQGIAFQPSDDIDKGFTISFDEGKSSFNFSDESLAEYIGSYLNDDIEEILKKSI